MYIQPFHLDDYFGKGYDANVCGHTTVIKILADQGLNGVDYHVVMMRCCCLGPGFALILVRNHYEDVQTSFRSNICH